MLPKRGIIPRQKRFILIDTHQRPTGRLDQPLDIRTTTIKTTTTTGTDTTTPTTATAAVMKRHHLILKQVYSYMEQEVLAVADELYDFQYGSDEHCHKTENLELRPLFTRLNNNYADWQRAKTAYLTGDYSVDPLRVMRQYRKTFAKFNRAFTNIGFADDFPEQHKRRMDATLLLFGRAELLGIIYGTGN